MIERVYSVSDFFDRPVSGAADFEGQPHWYARRFNEGADEYEDVYELTPLPQVVLAAEVERHQLFEAWREAVKAGLADRTTHPALPAHRERYDELASIVRKFIEAASFDVRAKAEWLHPDVLWERVDG